MSGAAIGLVLVAAFAHAGWNLFAKRAGRAGVEFVWLYTGAELAFYAPAMLVAISLTAPRVGPTEVVFIGGSAVLHAGYFLVLQRGYATGDLSFVYPVARGLGPLLAVVGAVLILPEAIRRFRQQYPAARIRIVEGLAHVLLPFVRDETLDFVMGLRESKVDPAIAFRPLYRSQLVVAVRKGHPLRNARSLTDLAHSDWLTTSTLGMPGGPLERMFASTGLPAPRPVMQCEAYNTIVALLAGSDMLGLMQRRLLAQPFAREFLQEIPVAEPLPSVTAGMFTRADTPLTRTAAAMVKAAVAASRNLARAAS